jgi:enoyl-CoA hydratase/carnithine racemase
MAPVEQYVDSQVAVITLNDGEHGNLLSPEGLAEVASAFDRTLHDPGVRAVLLRSNGPAFCLGMDLARLAAHDSARSRRDAEEAVDGFSGLLQTIYSAHLPVVCLVEGEVKAGGVGLACACDIVVATERATFELGEVIFGLIPANVLPLLTLRVSPATARSLVMGSRRLSAPEALRLNLVDELVPGTDAERRVREIFKRLLCSSPRALAAAKEFTAELVGMPLEQGGILARQRLVEMMHDPRTLEGVAAFQEGHMPAWFSRFRPSRPLSLSHPGDREEGTR